MITSGNENNQQYDINHWRNVIRLVVEKITNPRKKFAVGYINSLLKLLDQAYDKYIEALAYENNITYVEFYNLIDILNDNLACLHAKVKSNK